MDHGGILGKKIKEGMPGKSDFIHNLKTTLEVADISDIATQDIRLTDNLALVAAAQSAVAVTYTIWDSTECNQEFILPQVPGVSESDMFGFQEKIRVIWNLCEKTKKGPLYNELVTRLYGSMAYSENYGIFPISATRALIGFSPFFRLFFPMKDNLEPYENHEQTILYQPLLDEAEFQRHFYSPKRMELFENCDNYMNQKYRYRVKQLRATEVQQMNALMINMEPEKFVFHDYNKIRDSLWYYDNVAQFAMEKRYKFHMWG